MIVVVTSILLVAAILVVIVFLTRLILVAVLLVGAIVALESEVGKEYPLLQTHIQQLTAAWKLGQTE